jgi:hypothetical protein
MVDSCRLPAVQQEPPVPLVRPLQVPPLPAEAPLAALLVVEPRLLPPLGGKWPVNGLLQLKMKSFLAYSGDLYTSTAIQVSRSTWVLLSICRRWAMVLYMVLEGGGPYSDWSAPCKWGDETVVGPWTLVIEKSSTSRLLSVLRDLIPILARFPQPRAKGHIG